MTTLQFAIPSHLPSLPGIVEHALKLAGGATSWEARGLWLEDDGTVVDETVTMLLVSLSYRVEARALLWHTLASLVDDGESAAYVLEGSSAHVLPLRSGPLGVDLVELVDAVLPRTA